MMYKWERDANFPVCRRLVNEDDPNYVLAYVDKTVWSCFNVAIIFPVKGADLTLSRMKIVRGPLAGEL